MNICREKIQEIFYEFELDQTSTIILREDFTSLITFFLGIVVVNLQDNFQFGHFFSEREACGSRLKSRWLKKACFNHSLIHIQQVIIKLL
jgi:hypothetical protein